MVLHVADKNLVIVKVKWFLLEFLLGKKSVRYW